jgi:hypothetical protein
MHTWPEFFSLLAVLGFELRLEFTLTLARQTLYCLSHSASPFL